MTVLCRAMNAQSSRSRCQTRIYCPQTIEAEASAPGPSICIQRPALVFCTGHVNDLEWLSHSARCSHKSENRLYLVKFFSEVISPTPCRTSANNIALMQYLLFTIFELVRILRISYKCTAVVGVNSYIIALTS